MLVLTRRESQTITLGDPIALAGRADEVIEITVLEVRGDQVRLGIKAPRGVAVDRTEIWQQKYDAHLQAAKEQTAPEQDPK